MQHIIIKAREIRALQSPARVAEGEERIYTKADMEAACALVLAGFRSKPVIEKIERISRPGLRVYRGREDIKPVMNGLGVAIVSTSQGVMTDRKARATGVGGEVLCIVV